MDVQSNEHYPTLPYSFMLDKINGFWGGGILALWKEHFNVRISQESSKFKTWNNIQLS